MDSVFTFIEAHPVLMTAVLAGVGYLIKRLFFEKNVVNSAALAGRDANITAGGHVVIGNGNKIETMANGANNLKKFEELINTAKWQKEFIGDQEFWVCESDSLFQIDLSSDEREEFSEPWTDKFPDKKASKQPICLKISGTVIKELTFIFCDGGRFLLPMPEIQGLDGAGKQILQWRKDSLGFKVGKIIGRYWNYGSIEEVATFTGIAVV